MPRIKSISFTNHPLFGTTEFDFTLPDGQSITPDTPQSNTDQIAESITLAGENGSGKTRLLEELYEGTKSEYFTDALVRTQHQTVITLDLSDQHYYDLEHPRSTVTMARLIASHDDDSSHIYRKVEFYHLTTPRRTTAATKTAAAAKTAKTTKAAAAAKAAKSSAPLPRATHVQHVGEKSTINEVTSFSLNSAYSATDINYRPRQAVRGVTDLTLDAGPLTKSEDVAHDITQLLIDVASQDNNDIALYVREHPGRVIPKTLLNNLRMARFTRAFAYMFGEQLQYKTVRHNIIPTFTKNGHEFDLNSLSSGEKQIVFRGAYLLRNINNLTGCPIFIDEPELSMHPKWAQKIYGYYHHIFQDAKGNQTSQIFTATHNEYVVDAGIHSDNSIILDICIDCRTSRKFSGGLAGVVLPSVTLAEIKYVIFGIPSADFHAQLYTYIQNTYVHGQAVRGIDDFLLHYQSPRKQIHYQMGKRLVTYHSLPTYIRNVIDHPNGEDTYTTAELTESIEYMIGLILLLRAKHVPPVN